MPEVKIDPDRIEELYATLYEEELSAEAMAQKLILFKRTLEEQGIDNSSLSGIHYYLDTLINLMEVLCSNITTLQDNATAIAEQFSNTDRNLAAMYGGTTESYRSYKYNRITSDYGSD
ncbi:hypothetical protein GCM10011409_13260 [Lentibacillus populi]|uniref:Uncharacterized protein n=1 Tax=Lentibacillus populi TaxID=1827502 RepID=A0A9W5TW60_9BACI|nr:hypothetical protein [Lentibacillus populi]GGB37215.1 hypothetical protein GCM10011409_13260 [Lentibacillus populi]